MSGDGLGRWIKNPYPGVQEAIVRLFALYNELRSLGKVIKYLEANELFFPHRVKGEIDWTGIDVAELHSILRNRRLPASVALSEPFERPLSPAKALLDAFRWHCQISPEISLPNRWARAHQNSRSGPAQQPKRP